MQKSIGCEREDAIQRSHLFRAAWFISVRMHHHHLMAINHISIHAKMKTSQSSFDRTEKKNTKLPNKSHFIEHHRTFVAAKNQHSINNLYRKQVQIFFHRLLKQIDCCCVFFLYFDSTKSGFHTQTTSSRFNQFGVCVFIFLSVNFVCSRVIALENQINTWNYSKHSNNYSVGFVMKCRWKRAKYCK